MSILGCHIHACICLRKSITALSTTFYGTKYQIRCITSLNSGIVLISVAANDQTPALPPNVMIEWNYAIFVKLVLYIFILWWNTKLKTVKTMSTRKAINAILINIRNIY